MSGGPEGAQPGMTRRRWVELGLHAAAFAGGALIAGESVLITETLLPPPAVPRGTITDTLIYTAFPTPQWWNPLGGMPVRVTDFRLWTGATAVWRGLLDESGALVPDTGLPVLLVRVPRVDTFYQLPSPLPWTLTEGFALFYDDPVRDIRIVAGFDRCTHMCCYPGWHVVTNPPPGRDYIVPPPTWDLYAQDPIYCICHGTQYDPLLLVADTNPHNGVRFPGLELVHTPGTFGMPLVPLRADNDVLVGRMLDARWYAYC